MSSFTEQVPLDPDDPELNYKPLRLERSKARTSRLAGSKIGTHQVVPNFPSRLARPQGDLRTC